MTGLRGYDAAGRLVATARLAVPGLWLCAAWDALGAWDISEAGTEEEARAYLEEMGTVRVEEV